MTVRVTVTRAYPDDWHFARVVHGGNSGADDGLVSVTFASAVDGADGGVYVVPYLSQSKIPTYIRSVPTQKLRKQTR